MLRALKAPLLLADNYDVSMFQIGAVNALVGATSTTRQRGWFSTERQLPAPRRIVLYQTDTGQRLGYVDEHQQWRRLNGQTESEKVISWVVATTRPAK
jgi:hypothetical protein